MTITATDLIRLSVDKNIQTAIDTLTQLWTQTSHLSTHNKHDLIKSLQHIDGWESALLHLMIHDINNLRTFSSHTHEDLTSLFYLSYVRQTPWTSSLPSLHPEDNDLPSTLNMVFHDYLITANPSLRTNLIRFALYTQLPVVGAINHFIDESITSGAVTNDY